MSFTSLVKFIPSYFILWDEVFFFLHSLSDSLLLACRKATDFCVLIFYPATLWNSFISSNSFCTGTLGFSI